MPVKKVTVARKDGGRKAVIPESARRYFPAFSETASSAKATAGDAKSSNAKAVTTAKEN